MNDTLKGLTEAYATSLQEYLVEPREAGLLRAYELGRRALTIGVGVTELGIVHGQALAVALAGAGTPDARAAITQRAAEFLGETMAPFEMMLCGYQESNILLGRLNETLEERVKERTAALRESEERFGSIFKQVATGIAQTDLTGRFVLVNDRYCDLVGRSREELLRLRMQDLTHPDDLPQNLAFFERLAAGGPDFVIEKRYVRPDGSFVWVNNTVSLIRDADACPRYIVAVVLDVTERKRLEKELQQHAEELAETARRKDEFLAMLAHELRNPLAPIRNALQIMRVAKGDTKEEEEARHIMERQVHHLVRLIDDLMDVSRITRGKIELRCERLDLATAMRSALEISRPHIEEARHEVTVALPPAPVWVHADPARLAQVVANLLNNATKYTEPEGRIWLAAERDGDRAVVRVRDSGVGIPAEMLPRVFDLFVQVPSSVQRSQGGLGIGLTLVKRLVEMHGGSVVSHSAGPRQGSEFIVYLPLAPEGPQGQEREPLAPKHQSAARPAAHRILVVDDNRDSAESLGVLLKRAGHQVRIAYSGPTALELARTFQPRLLLQDIEMPGMNGYEVARRLRAQPATKKMLLVAMTGYGNEEDRRRSQEAGFDHHLVKPVDLDVLQELLASLEPLP